MKKTNLYIIIGVFMGFLGGAIGGGFFGLVIGGTFLGWIEFSTFPGLQGYELTAYIGATVGILLGPFYGVKIAKRLLNS